MAEENAEFARAVKAGQVPDTALSRLVFDNWKRFPDCILLTQVGNFFEVRRERRMKLTRSRTSSPRSRLPDFWASS